ncbi:MAG: thioesterase family protein [Litorimonas sp.]
MANIANDGFILTWAGECCAWECDELGHLNMRHYVNKFSQARQFIFIKLGLVNAFKPHAQSSVRVKNLHIKYLGEARPGDPLKIMSAVLSVQDQTITLCHIMYHTDDRIAATQVETIEHIYLRNYKTFAWPKRLLKNAISVSASCPDSPPQPAMSRNIDIQTPHIGHNSSTFDTLGLAPLGAGVFTAAEMNAAGFATPEAVFGRSTSTAGWFSHGWPELFDASYQAGHGSAAVLEIYIVFHKDPCQGDAYEYRSAILAANSYTRTFLHNFNDAVTGECLSSSVVNGCLFNLKDRKLTKANEAQLAVLQPFIREDLTP